MNQNYSNLFSSLFLRCFFLKSNVLQDELPFCLYRSTGYRSPTTWLCFWIWREHSGSSSLSRLSCCLIDSFDPESDGQPALNMTSSGLFGNPKARHAPVNSNKHRPWPLDSTLGRTGTFPLLSLIRPVDNQTDETIIETVIKTTTKL